MSLAAPVPCVWVVASHRILQNPSGHRQMYTVVDEGGHRTMLNMGLQPMCYPRVPLERVDALLAGVDGILLGGSDTNVHPHLYGEEPARPDFEFDPERDELARALIALALQRRVPIISFCRGSQDFNVAMGGSLHQWLRDRRGGVKHWEDPEEGLDESYQERHAVTVRPGGALEAITGMQRFDVSSLHAQGVKELGRDLVAEAHADDGLVEAFRWKDESLFAWGFQFHPEWNWRIHPAYGRIMEAYRQACWERMARRIASATSPNPAPRSPCVT
ncbi:MAG TPA: gamma-glutamyl-gamma-aminobutyrate hydrolase family protein [Ramlibacter sp.]|jgi:putative glutamine amidotransferase